MADTLKQCEWCGKEFSAKRSTAKFCSAACKLKSSRASDMNTELIKEDLPPVVQASKISPAPKKEVEDKIDIPQVDPKTGRPLPGSPEWYRHGTPNDPDASWGRVCVRCGKDFHTTLELRRFCSDLCFSEVMIVIADGPHPNYVKWLNKEVS